VGAGHRRPYVRVRQSASTSYPVLRPSFGLGCGIDEKLEHSELASVVLPAYWSSHWTPRQKPLPSAPLFLSFRTG